MHLPDFISAELELERVVSLQSTIIARLVASGIRAEAVADAIALLRTGRADLVEKVTGGELHVDRALKIAKRRSRP
jgi:hypothetical protein